MQWCGKLDQNVPALLDKPGNKTAWQHKPRCQSGQIHISNKILQLNHSSSLPNSGGVLISGWYPWLMGVDTSVVLRHLPISSKLAFNLGDSLFHHKKIGQPCQPPTILGSLHHQLSSLGSFTFPFFKVNLELNIVHHNMWPMRAQYKECHPHSKGSTPSTFPHLTLPLVSSTHPDCPYTWQTDQTKVVQCECHGFSIEHHMTYQRP